MPSLRPMSGSDVVSAFQQLGFEIHGQRGSHVKLRRTGAGGERQTLIVPIQKELDTGTLRYAQSSGRLAAMLLLAICSGISTGSI